MPDYINRSYIPFMKAVWKVQNHDKSIPQPPILVVDHEKLDLLEIKHFTTN
jgi:hypothetical protein